MSQFFLKWYIFPAYVFWGLMRFGIITFCAFTEPGLYTFLCSNCAICLSVCRNIIDRCSEITPTSIFVWNQNGNIRKCLWIQVWQFVFICTLENLDVIKCYVSSSTGAGCSTEGCVAPELCQLHCSFMCLTASLQAAGLLTSPWQTSRWVLSVRDSHTWHRLLLSWCSHFSVS